MSDGPIDLVEALRTVFDPRVGWCFLPQLADGTGGRANRTADAVGMNVWPSRGLEIHGFELKSYRSDWVRELRDPAKAEAIFQYCDAWSLVTLQHGEGSPILRAGELPTNWGHIEINATTRATKILVKAKGLKPKALTRVFLGSIVRNLERNATPAAELVQAKETARLAGYEAGRKHERDAQRYRSSSTFDRAESQLGSLLYLEKTAERILKDIRSGAKELRAELGDPHKDRARDRIFYLLPEGFPLSKARHMVEGIEPSDESEESHGNGTGSRGTESPRAELGDASAESDD